MGCSKVITRILSLPPFLSLSLVPLVSPSPSPFRSAQQDFVIHLLRRAALHRGHWKLCVSSDCSSICLLSREGRNLSWFVDHWASWTKGSDTTFTTWRHRCLVGPIKELQVRDLRAVGASLPLGATTGFVCHTLSRSTKTLAAHRFSQALLLVNIMGDANRLHLPRGAGKPQRPQISPQSLRIRSLCF